MDRGVWWEVHRVAESWTRLRTHAHILELREDKRLAQSCTAGQWQCWACCPASQSTVFSALPGDLVSILRH